MSIFEAHMELIKTAGKYSLMAIGVGALTMTLWKQVTRLMRGAGQRDDSRSDEELERKRKENKELMEFHLRKPPEIWNTAFFFPDPDHDNPDVPDSSTKKLLHLLDSAQLSIKVCMYLSSYRAIENKIVQKKQEGLIVQVCTCFETTEGHNNYQVKVYTGKGIPVRMKQNLGNFMHHKFVIIDDEAVITGSLNWTRQGIARNRENVVVTTDPRIVRPYRKEFATLWNNFDDYKELTGNKKEAGAQIG